MEHVRAMRQQIQRPGGHVYDRLYTRRVSIFLTIPLARLGVTPNAVSAAGGLLGLVICALIAFGDSDHVLAGCLLVHLYSVLDSVDGELARLTRTFSLKGLFLEDLSAYAMINGFHLAVAFHVWRTSGDSWLFVLAVLYTAFGRNAMPVARRALIKSVQTRRPLAAAREAAAPPARSSAHRALGPIVTFLEEQVLHVTATWVVVSAILILETLGWPPAQGATKYGLAFFLLLAALKEAAVLVVLLRGDSLERELAGLYDVVRQGPAPMVDPLGLAEAKTLSRVRAAIGD